METFSSIGLFGKRKTAKRIDSIEVYKDRYSSLLSGSFFILSDSIAKLLFEFNASAGAEKRINENTKEK